MPLTLIVVLTVAVLFLVAGIISLTIPMRLGRRRKIVFVLGAAYTGGLFAMIFSMLPNLPPLYWLAVPAVALAGGTDCARAITALRMQADTVETGLAGKLHALRPNFLQPVLVLIVSIPFGLAICTIAGKQGVIALLLFGFQASAILAGLVAVVVLVYRQVRQFVAATRSSDGH